MTYKVPKTLFRQLKIYKSMLKDRKNIQGILYTIQLLLQVFLSLSPLCINQVLQSGSQIILRSSTWARKCDFKETVTFDPKISSLCLKCNCNEGRCNTTLLHNNITKTNIIVCRAKNTTSLIHVLECLKFCQSFTLTQNMAQTKKKL